MSIRPSRTRIFALAALCTIAMATSGAGDALDGIPVGVGPVLEDRYPERRHEFPGQVTSLADLTYSAPIGFRPLRLDLYYSRTAASPQPLVIYVHGGGWQAGHTRQSGAFEDWPAVLAFIAAKGYVVASLEYRLSGEARFPAAIQDVKTAIRWLRARADDFHIDRQRAVIWGGSAGGQLAALAGTSCGVAALEPATPLSMGNTGSRESDCVQGVITWYGIFDFSTLLAQSRGTGPLSVGDARAPPSLYLGCALATCDAAALAAASPATYIDSKDPPVLMIHGVEDRVVPIQQSRDFLARLRSQGVTAELIEIPKVDHSFVGADLKATQAASHQALAASLQFIERTVGTASQ